MGIIDTSHTARIGRPRVSLALLSMFPGLGRGFDGPGTSTYFQGLQLPTRLEGDGYLEGQKRGRGWCLPICPSSCFSVLKGFSSRFSGSNVNMQGPAGQCHACAYLGMDHRAGVDQVCSNPAFVCSLHDASCRSHSTIDQDFTT